MSTVQWQLEHDSARSYEDVSVPALFGPAARQVVQRAAIPTGSTVLDVGCGTGAAARHARARAGRQGRVVAADVNRHMLDVGRLACPDVEFWDADAQSLPFPDRSFDVVLCTQSLQFVPDRERATAELARVVRAGGTVAVSCWAGLERQPFLAALEAALRRHLGPEQAAPLRDACSLADADALAGLLRGAGLSRVQVEEDEVRVTVGDIASFVPRYLAATPMAAVTRQAPSTVRTALAQDVAAELGHRADTLRFVQHVATG